MATFTSRMGLTKPAGSEARSVTPLNSNSDLLDKFMPCILVNDGVTPPTGDLYDGALVKERTSGIIWEARKNGGGTYDKVYVRYPFYMQALDNGTPAQAWGTSYVPANGFTWEAGKNSSSSQISGGKVKIPLNGSYDVWLKCAFDSNGTGERSMALELNSTALIGYNYEDVRSGASSGGQACHLTLAFPKQFAANDIIAVTAWQNSGGNLTRRTARINLALIEPF